MVLPLALNLSHVSFVQWNSENRHEIVECAYTHIASISLNSVTTILSCFCKSILSKQPTWITKYRQPMGIRITS